jgi:agmatinase
MPGTPTFALPPRFLALDRPVTEAEIVIAGIPLDIGTTNRSGTRFGPTAIRHASRMLVDGDHPHWWVDPRQLPIADAGDFALALGDIQQSLSLIEQQARPYSHLVALGGEHGVTLPLLRAAVGRLGRPLALIHFDAHVDTWPENFGQPYAHGTVFFHAIQERLIDPAHTIQIGIRSPVQRQVFDWTVDRGVRVVSAQEVYELGPTTIADRVIQTVGQAPVYLSFDVDVFDPGFAPGTGTPEFGGLAPWQVQAILRRLDAVRFVGMDVVEVSPPYDHAELTALAAATVAWEYLAIVGRHLETVGSGAG